MKTILTLLMACLGAQLSLAQSRITTKLPLDHNLTGESAPYNTGFGVKGGLNYSTFRGAGTPAGVEMKPSFHAGVYSQFRLSNSFSLQPELLYSRRGYRGTPSMKLDYLELPVLLVYNVAYRWSIQAGPQIGYLVTVRENEKEVDRTGYRAMDFGGAVGTEFRAGFVRLGARYNHGFRDIKIGTADMKHSFFQLYLGLGF